jgi:hypothetical protein
MAGVLDWVPDEDRWDVDVDAALILEESLGLTALDDPAGDDEYGREVS